MPLIPWSLRSPSGHPVMSFDRRVGFLYTVPSMPQGLPRHPPSAPAAILFQRSQQMSKVALTHPLARIFSLVVFCISFAWDLLFFYAMLLVSDQLGTPQLVVESAVRISATFFAGKVFYQVVMKQNINLFWGSCYFFFALLSGDLILFVLRAFAGWFTMLSTSPTKLTAGS